MIDPPHADGPGRSPSELPLLCGIRATAGAVGNPQVSIDVLLSWATNRFAAIEVGHQPRREGRSGYTLRTLVRHALNMITGFSIGPLRLASAIGVASTLFGLLVLAQVVNYGTVVRDSSLYDGLGYYRTVTAFEGTQHATPPKQLPEETRRRKSQDL